MYSQIDELKALIDDKLTPLLLPKCYILDAPYYENVGDVLIYEGEKEFLARNNVSVVGVYSYNTFDFNMRINEDTFIAINGGGNYGDLYPEHLDFLIRLLQSYPNIRIIVFPQTIYFKNRIKADVIFKELSRYPNLYICARDARSFQLLSDNLPDRQIFLLPDMAFYIGRIHALCHSAGNTLFIKRVDAESSSDNSYDERRFNRISDWPSFQHSLTISSFIAKVLNNLYQKIRFKPLRQLINRLWNLYFPTHCKMMIREGIQFISPYSHIHTTRLHGAILAILLGKEDIVIYDNSYGKNYTFYQTWLKDFPNVRLLSNHN